ncbi:FISUMP domain-containing protein [Fibrobacter sp.]
MRDNPEQAFFVVRVFQGCELKSKSGWNVYMSYYGGSDVHGFSALPGGYMYAWERAFYGLGETAQFWSSSENGSTGAMYAVIRYNSDNMQIGMDGRDNYMSVRCLQN